MSVCSGSRASGLDYNNVMFPNSFKTHSFFCAEICPQEGADETRQSVIYYHYTTMTHRLDYECHCEVKKCDMSDMKVRRCQERSKASMSVNLMLQTW